MPHFKFIYNQFDDFVQTWMRTKQTCSICLTTTCGNFGYLFLTKCLASGASFHRHLHLFAYK